MTAVRGAILPVLALAGALAAASAPVLTPGPEREVAAALAAVFSYTPDDVAATGRRAGRLLTGRAADGYRALFATVAEQAPAQRVALTTRVVSTVADRVAGRTATLTAVLDQRVTRDGRQYGPDAAARLRVTAVRSGGHWRISDIHAL